MAEIGVIGLGTMGANLALNFAEHGFGVAVFNRTTARTHDFMAGAGDLAGNLTPCDSLAALVAALTRPRAVILMVPAGPVVDDQITALIPHLARGDAIIDAGNANFRDTRRRATELGRQGFALIGMGVSGGSQGARYGPSIMVGAEAEVYARLAPMIEAIAAKFEGDPCAARLGPDGAGHFVKTVHNGIEYADMQVIAEAYGLMRDGQGMAAAAIGKRFAKWNVGNLQSYLAEITGAVLCATDPATGKPVVDVILDRAGQKGTGRWTLIEALELGQSATTIEAAVAARSWSADHGLRQVAAKVLGPETGGVDLPDATLENAMLAARIIAYAQGFALLEAASQRYDWGLDHARIAEIWRAGCIIRSALLDDIAGAFHAGPREGNLLLAPAIAAKLSAALPDLRRTVAAGVGAGLPVPAMAAALGYFDSLRQARDTTDLIQAQRDFFGAHGFERRDKPGAHHGPWR